MSKLPSSPQPSPPSDGGEGEGSEASAPLNCKGNVLMLDARSIGQLMKGSRKVHEFTPEQMRNLTAIVWLYRGQRDRFLALVQDYFKRHAAECAAVPEKIAAFDTAFAALDVPFAALSALLREAPPLPALSPAPSGGEGGRRPGEGKPDLDAEKAQALTETLAELRDARRGCDADAKALLADLAVFEKKTDKSLPATNDQQHAARKAFDPVAERAKGFIKQVDLLYKLASRAASIADLSLSAAPSGGEGGRRPGEGAIDVRPLRKLIKQLDEQRRAAVEQLKHATYFHRHIVWLQDRFPKAEMQPVPGLVKVVTRKDIEAADWSLTPGRYVGVTPAEVDEDFDFEQAIADIHEELAGLNTEAAELAANIQENLESLGV